MPGDIADLILSGAREAADYAQGLPVARAREYRVQIPDQVPVRDIRVKLGMTQQRFADTFGFSLGALRKWESGTRTPERAARVLLKVIEHHPQIVLEATSQSK